VYCFVIFVMYENVLSQGQAKMMKDGKVFRVIQENCWDPVVRIKEMDLSGTSTEELKSLCLIQNTALLVHLKVLNNCSKLKDLSNCFLSLNPLEISEN